jgi:hypothetical protein
MILVYDDKPDGIVKKLKEHWPKVHSANPKELDESVVRSADLFVMDYHLGGSHGDKAEFLKKHMTGMSAVEAIKSFLKSSSSRKRRIFLLYSGKLDDLAEPLPAHGREHIIARNSDFHWALEKGYRGNVDLPAFELVSCVRALLDALDRLPSSSSKRTSAVLFRSLLNIPKLSWGDRAWTMVEEHQPPLSDIMATKDWTLVIKWLLHAILPFPAFLIDSVSLAARLRVTPSSLEKAMENKQSRFARSLINARYTGLLCDFFGPRWWRIGIDQFIWDVTDGRPFDGAILRSKLLDISDKLKPLNVSDPVRMVDDEFRLTDELVSADDAVQLQTADWPAYVEHPWRRLADVAKKPELRELVIPSHQSRLPA